MDVLWSVSRPLTAREVCQALKAHDLAYTTVKTVLDRLHHKKLVHREQGEERAWRYRPVNDRDAHIAELMLHALNLTEDRDGALVRFAETVSPADASVLRQALDPTRASAPETKTGQQRGGT
jgi:predicted transcriptional regulator